jgi:hypothetical protein
MLILILCVASSCRKSARNECGAGHTNAWPDVFPACLMEFGRLLILCNLVYILV